MVLHSIHLRALALVVAVLGLITWSVVAQAADGDFDDGDVPVADNTDTASVENLGPFGGNLWDVAFILVTKGFATVIYIKTALRRYGKIERVRNLCNG